jgi:magnesium-transporting ATPase (P-type)
VHLVHPKARKRCSVSWHEKIPFHHIVRSVVVSSSCWLMDHFFHPSLSFLENYKFFLLVFGISILILILFIFNFWYWPFCKNFSGFQIEGILVFNLVLIISISNFFLGFFVKFIFFLISSFNYNTVILCQFWSSFFFFSFSF